MFGTGVEKAQIDFSKEGEPSEMRALGEVSLRRAAVFGGRDYSLVSSLRYRAFYLNPFLLVRTGSRGKGVAPQVRGLAPQPLGPTSSFTFDVDDDSWQMSVLPKLFRAGASSARQLTSSTSNEPIFLSPWTLWQRSYLAGSTLLVGAAVLVLDITCIILLSWAYGCK